MADNGLSLAGCASWFAGCASIGAYRSVGLADTREKLEEWHIHYNEDRPHSAIGYNVPITMHYPDGVTSPSS